MYKPASAKYKCPCGKRQSYGFPGGKQTHCKKCAVEGMIGLANKRCSCGKNPTFGYPDKKATHCKSCAEEGMINVACKKCSCGTQASFGYPGKSHTHCKSCAEEGMINVISKRCPCGTLASFGYPGKSPICCKKCAEEGMINIAGKRCSCGTRASFGFPDGKATHCKKCAEEGMIDVVHDRCSCGTRASFGFPDGKATHCKKCAEEGMIDVVHHDTCPCGSRVSYGYPDERPTCCSKCQKPGMIDVVTKTCPGYNGVSCPVITYLSQGNKYCIACDPNDSRRLAHKKDEEAFFSFLENNNIDITIREYQIHYNCIDNSSKKYSRIDGVIITPNIVMCLELDEDAHEYYDPLCEESRMHDASAELKLAYPNHHIAWIRVNPHTKKNGVRDKSKRSLKIRDERHAEAMDVIRELLTHPRSEIMYIGY